MLYDFNKIGFVLRHLCVKSTDPTRLSLEHRVVLCHIVRCRHASIGLVFRHDLEGLNFLIFVVVPYVQLAHR